ncbi:hypothetical protein [Novosphingobium sp. ZW T3_23]|uniref:hypothetical protein n=1 Tax=Novosphingobium sp. ZW T3_23 TaxID=3378084 RepID=UPI0038552505
MSARTAASWQTSLADLSLILFMIAAAALNRQQGHLRQESPARAAERRPASPSSPEGTPLAIYIAAPDAPPLASWLAGQARDARQRVTVAVPYGPAAQDLERALSEARLLAAEAGRAGHKARIVVEPGIPAPARVVLAFDDPDEGLARSLLPQARNLPEGTRSR